MKEYKYYTLMRPVGIGAVPDGLKDFTNYDERTYVDCINRRAWGEVIYDKPLSAKDISDFQLAADPSIKFKLDERLFGDELLNAQDMVDEIKEAGGKVDDYGNVTLYHRTSEKFKTIIEEKGYMVAKEDSLFFSTKETGQNEGYGNAIVKLSVPVEKLVIDDYFGDEIHFRIPLDKSRRLDVSAFLIKEAQKPRNKEVERE